MSLGARDLEVDRMMEVTLVSGQKLGSLVSEGHPHLLASKSPYPPRPSFPPSPTHLEQARYLQSPAARAGQGGEHGREAVVGGDPGVRACTEEELNGPHPSVQAGLEGIAFYQHHCPYAWISHPNIVLQGVCTDCFTFSSKSLSRASSLPSPSP